MNRSEFEEWRNSIVTQEFMGILTKRRDELKEQWATGEQTYDNLDANTLKNTELQAGCIALEEIIGMDFDDIKIISNIEEDND